MPTYNAERTAFLVAFGREFPAAPQSAALALLRAASTCQSAVELLCSVEMSPRETARVERRDAAATARARKIAESIGAKFIDGSGDPRGFPFLIGCPSGRTFDWGGRGLGVPGRGLPASAFAR